MKAFDKRKYVSMNLITNLPSQYIGFVSLPSYLIFRSKRIRALNLKLFWVINERLYTLRNLLYTVFINETMLLGS